MSKISLKPNSAGTANFEIAAPATNTDRTLFLPDEAGTLLTGAVASFSTGSGTANSVASNTYVNIVSNLSLPNNSMIIAFFKVTTSDSNDPSNATYSMHISTTSTSATLVASQNGVGVYPKSGIGRLDGTLVYFNSTGSTQSIYLSGQPFASSGYNTPDYEVNYYIVSFA